MIDDFPLSFFLPLVVHALAGLMTGVAGIMAFRASICPGYADGTAWAALADLLLRPGELGTQPARPARPPERRGRHTERICAVELSAREAARSLGLTFYHKFNCCRLD